MLLSSVYVEHVVSRALAADQKVLSNRTSNVQKMFDVIMGYVLTVSRMKRWRAVPSVRRHEERRACRASSQPC
jgi:hypothetical protein